MFSCIYPSENPHRFRRNDNWTKQYHLVFKDDSWEKTANRRTAYVYVVGKGLRSLGRKHWNGKVRATSLALLVRDTKPDPLELKSAFLASLRKPYTYNEKDREIFFPKLKLTLNIDVLYGDRDIVSVREYAKLFRERDHCPETSVAVCEEKSVIYDLGGQCIGGNCNQHPPSMNEIKTACMLNVHVDPNWAEWFEIGRPDAPELRRHNDETGCFAFHKCQLEKPCSCPGKPGFIKSRRDHEARHKKKTEEHRRKCQAAKEELARAVKTL